MPINTLAAAQIFQSELDKLAIQEMTTGWMDGNAGQVKYNGGDTVRIPTLSMNGLGDYDRDTGFVRGSITTTWETKTLTQDRGRFFNIDAMDVDESNWIATAGNVLSEFQRLQVVPEIDAYRISKLANIAITAGNKEEGYASSALAALKRGIKNIREYYGNSNLVAHATLDFVNALEIELAGHLQSVTFSVNGVDTRVPSVDGVPIIPTAAARMLTAITLYDGTTSGQTAGGYVAGANADTVNFLVTESRVPLAITKQDKVRIFTPDENQEMDAYKISYRRFHDLWVKDNQTNGLFVNYGTAH